MPRSMLPWLLAANGGYVDTTSFLALHGLFASHVTGNFVTIGAALVLGTGGVLAKLLALPVFCIVVGASRLLSGRLPSHASLRPLLLAKMLLLAAGAALGIRLGPFADGEGWAPLAIGMLLVAAMAIQNALQRVHLTQYPPTTIMTGNTTQFMVDLADLVRGVPADARAALQARARRLGLSILLFASGCTLAALFFAGFQMWSLLLPPVFAMLTLLVSERTPI